MRVVVAGTFCSGKTTLAGDLTRTFDGATLVGDECRPILDLMPKVDWSAPELRSYLIVRQVLVELHAYDASGLQIIDGGVINNVAHDRSLLAAPPDRSRVLESLLFPRYDLVFLCDPEGIDVMDDGQRYTDDGLRRQLDVHVSDVAHDMGYSPIRLSGSREARRAEAASIIASHRA